AATVQPSAGALQRGNYYIQVAAYRSESTTREAIAVLDRAGYVTVIEIIADKKGQIWRVYIGPLSRDESGVALVRVRSLGYKDAFLKKGT
ncbi:MAG: SPOR domain-containing protein, partial [Spirochaetales bacterium]